MSEKIEPAMTPEQWRAAIAYEASIKGWEPMYAVNGQEMTRHALAARALYGQPFGFAAEDAEFLRLVAGQCDALRLGDNHARYLRSLADRIAALLPPEP